MNVLAAGFALALLLSQSGPSPAPAAEQPTEQSERPPATPAEAEHRPETEPPATAPAAEPPAHPAGESSTPAPVPPVRGEPRPVPAPATPPSRMPAAAPAVRPPAAAPAPTSPVLPPAAAPPAKPTPEREQAARVALAFLDALVAADPVGLTAACAERFSFDGDVRAGADAVRAGWREALAARHAAGPARLDDLELLTAPEAVARLGPPPARIAPLTQRGGWVALANLSGRPVVLFLVREGARMVVAGMHD